MTVKNTSGWVPTGHRILVKVDQFERKTQSGIIIADAYADKEQLGQDAGTVVEIGNTAYSDQKSPWCSVGDHIKFGRYAGQIIKVTKDDGTVEEYRVINDLDVALVKKGEVNE
jgi:co-chaperonin GroES (HSP10)